MKCAECRSDGFAPSVTGHGCSFCDGTVGGNPPKKIDKPKLGRFQFACPKCAKVHNKSVYCIAQQAMHHEMMFTCDCGHNFTVPN
jgi:hypothetical protein